MAIRRVPRHETGERIVEVLLHDLIVVIARFRDPLRAEASACPPRHPVTTVFAARDPAFGIGGANQTIKAVEGVHTPPHHSQIRNKRTDPNGAKFVVVVGAFSLQRKGLWRG